LSKNLPIAAKTTIFVADFEEKLADK